jgi:hypothetical protein
MGFIVGGKMSSKNKMVIRRSCILNTVEMILIIWLLSLAFTVLVWDNLDEAWNYELEKRHREVAE